GVCGRPEIAGAGSGPTAGASAGLDRPHAAARGAGRKFSFCETGGLPEGGGRRDGAGGPPARRAETIGGPASGTKVASATHARREPVSRDPDQPRDAAERWVAGECRGSGRLVWAGAQKAIITVRINQT